MKPSTTVVYRSFISSEARQRHFCCTHTSAPTRYTFAYHTLSLFPFNFTIFREFLADRTRSVYYVLILLVTQNAAPRSRRHRTRLSNENRNKYGIIGELRKQTLKFRFDTQIRPRERRNSSVQLSFHSRFDGGRYFSVAYFLLSTPPLVELGLETRVGDRNGKSVFATPHFHVVVRSVAEIEIVSPAKETSQLHCAPAYRQPMLQAGDSHRIIKRSVT